MQFDPNCICFLLIVASSVFGVVLVAGFVRYAHVKRPRVLILNARAPNLGVREFSPGESRLSERAVLPTACSLCLWFAAHFINIPGLFLNKLIGTCCVRAPFNRTATFRCTPKFSNLHTVLRRSLLHTEVQNVYYRNWIINKNWKKEVFLWENEND